MLAPVRRSTRVLIVVGLGIVLWIAHAVTASTYDPIRGGSLAAELAFRARFLDMTLALAWCVVGLVVFHGWEERSCHARGQMQASSTWNRPQRVVIFLAVGVFMWLIHAVGAWYDSEIRVETLTTRLLFRLRLLDAALLTVWALLGAFLFRRRAN